MKIKRRFYVGADRVLKDNWAHGTLQQAIDHAKELLEDSPLQDEKIVVQIVRVVRRKSPPMIVEKVV